VSTDDWASLESADYDDWESRESLESLGVNIAMPNVARIYDYFLDGKDNFAADRAAATAIASTAPDVVQRVRENRAFLGRAVRFAAEAGVRQFIDIGTGLPTRDNVHQVAQRLIPDAHVVYVDNDPVVLVHARAFLATDECTIVVDADMREPAKILQHAREDEFIDLDQPVAILMLAVLHFLPDTDQAAEIVATIRQAMAPGSYLMISHGTPGDMSPQNLSRAVYTYAATSIGSLTLRSPAEIASFFDGLELAEPGLVPVARWRPEEESPATTSGAKFLGGIARKI
jgi:O-methyltransferase involved in polyketide biosynthesis